MSLSWNVARSGFLLHATVVHGVGDSGVGLDRGEIGPSLVAVAEPDGDTALVRALNVAYGANGTLPAERAAAAESFATSVLARCDIAADGGLDLAGLALVDLVGAGQRIGDGYGAAVHLVPELSRVVDQRRYGDVLTLEADLTFARSDLGVEPASDSGHSPRNRVRPVLGQVAPAGTVTIRQQVAVRALPNPVTPLPMDGTAGAMPGLLLHRFDTVDAADAHTPIAVRFTGPITFHLDPAMPRALQQAALEGGGWWRAAFEPLGVPYTFELLPPDADWRDPRLNVVLWVHRADRGWSYGMTQVDPRTGQIVRGVVRIGSQRVEQVRAIAEAVLSPYQPGEDRTQEADGVVLARVSQLVAHETGHAIGFAHNFASHLHAHPSVMDYPAPRFTLTDGRPSSPDPYARGLGPWDVHQARVLYGDSAEPFRAAVPYVTDADSRTDDAASACAATWIAPGEPVAVLEELVDVRAAALSRFSPAVVRPGSDPGELVRRFTLVYLLHRYQAVAVAKLVGGLRWPYQVTGPSYVPARTVPADEQQQALRLLATLITPAFLQVPHRVAALLLPPSGGRPVRAGGIEGRTGGVFDLAAAAAAATEVVAGPLLAPARLNRVAQQADDGGIGLAPVLEVTLDHAIGLLQDRVDTVSEAIGWAVLARLEATLTSGVLHTGAAVQVIDRLETLGTSSRPSLAGRLKRLLDAAAGTVADPTHPPLGTPI